MSASNLQQATMPTPFSEDMTRCAPQEGVEDGLETPSATSEPGIADVEGTSTATIGDDARPPASRPQYHIRSLHQDYEIYGVDAIWHNQYAGPDSDFGAFRKAYDCDISTMLCKVTEHVRQGVYAVVSLTATPHMLSVVVVCQKMMADFPDDFWDEPVSVPGLFVPIES